MKAKILYRAVEARSLTTSSTVYRIVIGPPGDGQHLRGSYNGKVSGSGGDRTTSSSGGNKDGMLRCPKCGNQCTHVETFVCEYCFDFIFKFNFIVDYYYV